MGDKGSLPLVSVLDMDVIISPADIKFGENLCSLEFINKVGDKWEGVCITDCVFIDIAVVLTGTDITILTKKKGNACGEFEGWILPVLRFLSRKSLIAFCSLGEREYALPILGLKASLRFILWL